MSDIEVSYHLRPFRDLRGGDQVGCWPKALWGEVVGCSHGCVRFRPTGAPLSSLAELPVAQLTHRFRPDGLGTKHNLGVFGLSFVSQVRVLTWPSGERSTLQNTTRYDFATLLSAEAGIREMRSELGAQDEFPMRALIGWDNGYTQTLNTEYTGAHQEGNLELAQLACWRQELDWLQLLQREMKSEAAERRNSVFSRDYGMFRSWKPFQQIEMS